MGTPPVPPPLEITIDLLAHATVVHIAGEIDLGSYPRLAQAVFETPGELPVVLDLERVGFIDSSGLGMLVQVARSRAGAAGLLICRPSAAVSRALGLAGLRGALPEVGGWGEEEVWAAAGGGR